MQIFSMLFSLLFLSFSAGQLGRLSFFRQEVNIYVYELFVALTFLVLFIRLRFKPIMVYVKSYKFLFGFLVYMFISLLISTMHFSVYQNEVAFLYYLRLAGYLIFLVYILYFFSKNRSVGRFVHTLVVFFLAVTIVTSIGQYYLYPDLRNLFYAGWDPHLYRMVGVFFEPPVAGALYGLLFYYLLIKPDKKYSSIRLLLLLILFVCIILTFSRGTYLGFAVSIVFYFFKSQHNSKKNLQIPRIKMNKLYLLIALIIISGGVFIASTSTGEGAHLTRTSTIESRLVNFQEGIRVWQKNPIFGVGYNHIRYAREVQQSNYDSTEELSHADASFHSSFLIILVSGGCIGLILYVLSLYEVGAIHDLAACSIVFLSVASITDNVLLHPFVLFFMSVLIGISTHPSDT